MSSAANSISLSVAAAGACVCACVHSIVRGVKQAFWPMHVDAQLNI